MSERDSEPDEKDTPSQESSDSGDEKVGLVGLQDNDSDTIKHSQDGSFEKREG